MKTTLMQDDTALDVFTYGSLMYPAVWSRVVRGDYASEPARVHGFRRVCVRNREHPALIVAAGEATVEGRLYRAVSASDLARLDHFETAAYARVAVAAQCGAVTRVAQTYLAINVDDLVLSEWSVARFEAEGLPVFLATYAVQNAPPE